MFCISLCIQWYKTLIRVQLSMICYHNRLAQKTSWEIRHHVVTKTSMQQRCKLLSINLMHQHSIVHLPYYHVYLQYTLNIIYYTYSYTLCLLKQSFNYNLNRTIKIRSYHNFLNCVCCCYQARSDVASCRYDTQINLILHLL